MYLFCHFINFYHSKDQVAGNLLLYYQMHSSRDSVTRCSKKNFFFYHFCFKLFTYIIRGPARVLF